MDKYRIVLTVVPNEEDDAPSKWSWYDLLGCEVELEKVEKVDNELSD